MPSVSAASAKGSRSYQEDRSVTADVAGGQLLAVFDGHRGAAAAEKAAHAATGLFTSALQHQQGDAAEALREMMEALVELTRSDEAGSTASVVYIPADRRQAFVAVLGDSPVAVIDEAGRLRVGPDHNVRSNLAERIAAQDRGANYSGGYVEDSRNPGTGLQMSRALGDAELDRILNRESEIYAVPLGPQSFILLGTDGLLEPSAAPLADQMKRLTEMVRQGAAAQAIVDDAIRRDTGDNVTAIVWKT